MPEDDVSKYGIIDSSFIEDRIFKINDLWKSLKKDALQNGYSWKIHNNTGDF